MTPTLIPALSGLDTLPAVADARLLLMAGLALLGVLLLFGSSRIAGWVTGRQADPVAVSRILRLAGVILLFSALAVRPYNPETAAFPPPPDAGAASR